MKKNAYKSYNINFYDLLQPQLLSYFLVIHIAHSPTKKNNDKPPKELAGFLANSVQGTMLEQKLYNLCNQEHHAKTPGSSV
jgi:hypothetical protein